jgi:inner membrane transporter RhtA
MTAAASPALGVTDRAPAWSLAILSMTSVQLGTALATGLFEAVGPAGTVWLRFTAGGLIFLAMRRPRLRGRPRRELLSGLALGAVTGAMSVLFLSAVARIPLGTTVAIEFVGPLAVSVGSDRRVGRLALPVLALGGVLLLTEPWVAGAVDPVGVLLAAGAAAGWGLYIVLTAHVGDRFEGLEGLSLTIPVAAITAAVVGVPQATAGSVTPLVLVAAAGLAILQPVLPFSLELLALRRLSKAAFGTLMALEPAIGLLIGAIVLAQMPTALQALGIALVVVAGIGAARGGGRISELPPPA